MSQTIVHSKTKLKGQPTRDPYTTTLTRVTSLMMQQKPKILNPHCGPVVAQDKHKTRMMNCNFVDLLVFLDILL